jgi:hypothetical protein
LVGRKRKSRKKEQRWLGELEKQSRANLAPLSPRKEHPLFGFRSRDEHEGIKDVVTEIRGVFHKLVLRDSPTRLILALVL